MAGRHGATTSQIALAWLLHRGDEIIPIPGTRHVAYVEQNAAAAKLVLDRADMATLDRAFAPDHVVGARHSEASHRFVDVEPNP